MTSLDRLEASALAAGPGDREVVASIQAGHIFTCILAEDPALCAAKLDAVLDSIADLDTRIVRVGNPLRSPLTIERILIQAAGPEADSRIERDPPLLAAVLAARVDDETRLLVAVEQPQTIDPDTLQILHAMRPYLEQTQPRVQFLFAGPPAFAAALASPDPPPAPTAQPASITPKPPRWRATAFALVAACIIVAAAAIALRPRPSPPPTAPSPPASSAEALPNKPVQTQAAQAAPASAPASMPTQQAPAVLQTPAPAESESDARLRREFDVFLARTGQPAARLPEAQRAALLDEFLAWRRARGSADHEDLAQPGAEHSQKVR